MVARRSLSLPRLPPFLPSANFSARSEEAPYVRVARSLMVKNLRPETRQQRPVISQVGSWLLASASALLVASLMFPWFEGKLSITYVQYYGYEIGFTIFYTISLAAAVGSAGWYSRFRSGSVLVLLSLAASILTTLFSGLSIAFSSTLTRLASAVGLGAFVSVRIRSGLVVLLVGGLIGIVGSTMLLAQRLRVPTSVKRLSSHDDSVHAESWFDEEDEFDWIPSGTQASHSHTFDDEDW